MTTKTKTFRLSGLAMDRKWHVIDAAGRPLGRVASEVAQLLLGKHKPSYEPHLAMGDHVIVVNAARVALTGNKAATMVYYRHSGYPGGLRERSFDQQMARDPRRVMERAVKGMLPHNSRGRELFRHMKVYAGADHPHEAQLRAGQGARTLRRAAAVERAASLAAAVEDTAVEDSVVEDSATDAAATEVEPGADEPDEPDEASEPIEAADEPDSADEADEADDEERSE